MKNIICIIEKSKNIKKNEIKYFMNIFYAEEIEKKLIFNYCNRNIVDAIYISKTVYKKYPKLTMDIINTIYPMGIQIILEGNIRTKKYQRKLIYRRRWMSLISINSMTAFDNFIKRAFDIPVALVGCILTIPLYICFGPLIYITSPGPIIYSQKRVGKNGRIFICYKFRTMINNADQKKEILEDKNEMNDYMFKIDNDPRILPGIGTFLRKTSIDEFPQFYNVLKGDMSIVGARPPLLEEYKKYSVHHKARLCANPGITGPWQISGRNNITDFEDIVSMDINYIKNWSIAKDIQILLKTIPSVLNEKGAK